MEFFRQKNTGVGCHSFLQAIFLTQRSNLGLLHCRQTLLPPEPPGKAYHLFQWVRWPKDWSFSFSICPSSEYSGLISFRMNWFDLLAVQGTLNSPTTQFKSINSSVFQHSAFFMVQFSHPNMTTGKTIALSRQTFVGKVISLLFNMLSRFVIAFLSRGKCLFV